MLVMLEGRALPTPGLGDCGRGLCADLCIPETHMWKPRPQCGGIRQGLGEGSGIS